MGDICVRPSQHKDTAGWHLLADLPNERESIAPRHRDITEKKVGAKASGAVEPIISRIAGYGFKTVLLKDDAKCIGDKMIIIYYQDPLR